MSDKAEKRQFKGIPAVAITDAAREAILAVQEAFKDYLPEIENSEYYRGATSAALRSALAAIEG